METEVLVVDETEIQVISAEDSEEIALAVAEILILVQESFIRQFVQNVRLNVKYLLSQLKESLFTAEIVLQNINLNDSNLLGSFFIFYFEFS